MKEAPMLVAYPIQVIERFSLPDDLEAAVVHAPNAAGFPGHFL